MANNTTICFKTLRFCRMRVARLRANGSPLPGDGNLYVTDQQVSLVLGLNYDKADDFTQKTGCGDLSFAFQGRDLLKDLNLTLIMATAEPQLVELLCGGTLLNVGTQTEGYALPAVGTVGNANGCSIEGWTLNIKGSAIDPTWPYVRWVIPLTYFTPANKTLANNPITHEYTGQGKENFNWNDGPANDWDFVSDRLYQYAADTILPSPLCQVQTTPAS